MNEPENRWRVYWATFDTNIFVRLSFELCQDPKDDIFVDCAVSGRVQFLVSYDNDLIDDSELKQALFEFGVEIVNPPNFLKEIQKE